MEFLGLAVRDLILSLAALLKNPSVPGLVALCLFVMCGVALFFLYRDMRARKSVLRRLSEKVQASDRDTFAGTGFDEISAWIRSDLEGAKKAIEPLQEAWDEFGETLFVDDRIAPPVRRNTERPGFFFNIDDLGYGPGFYRILPGIFVSIGLALTFLGLIGALRVMSDGGEINDVTMLALIGIASAKFIMSLSGLACSIVLILGMKVMIGGVDNELHRLVRRLERRFDFVSIESIALEQLRVQRDAQEANKALAYEMVAELGRPLREELPRAISDAINKNMQPILEEISKKGSDTVGTMAADLSKQVTDGMAGALAAASDSMARAGKQIEQLANRMDGSSGRMGSEMESSVSRVALAVDELRSAMSNTAEQTGGAFTRGAEQLLEVMNRTLEGIRDNTGESTRAMSLAAEEMTKAARTMKDEMEGAAKAGSEAARGRMVKTGDEVGAAITSAGASIAETYEAAAGRIAQLGQSLSDQTGQDLLEPLKDIQEQLKAMVNTLDDGVRKMQGFASAVGDGAQAGNAAADNIRSASSDLVSAVTPIRGTVERIETATKSLNDGVSAASQAVIRSSEEVAQSAARTLTIAGETIGGEQRAIATVVTSIEGLVRAMKGQGDRIDDIDTKLGGAFELYANSTETSMQAIRSHVQEMASELNTALDALRAIVDSLQAFEPQQSKRGS
jgi:methyl-accepting chemotaxis protein